MKIGAAYCPNPFINGVVTDASPFLSWVGLTSWSASEFQCDVLPPDSPLLHNGRKSNVELERTCALCT